MLRFLRGYPVTIVALFGLGMLAVFDRTGLQYDDRGAGTAWFVLSSILSAPFFLGRFVGRLFASGSHLDVAVSFVVGILTSLLIDWMIRRWRSSV